jgi:signal transduction histidine kinase
VVTEGTAPHRCRSPRGRGARLREEILAAADRLLEELRDLDAVSMRAVADAVGVTPATIYRHFTDRNELIFEICERRFRELDRVVEEAAARSRDPLESLRLRGRAYVRFGLAHPEEYRIWFMSKPGATPDWTVERIIKGPVVTHLVQAVQACLDAAVIRPADPTLVAFGLWSAVHGLTSLLITKPAFPWPDLDELIDHILSMLAAGLVPGREELTKRAVAAERSSIARELHDVIAHNVSVMVVQAGANRVNPPAGPEAASEAFAAIEATGRQALSETRTLLGLMRREGERQSPAPQPGLEHLTALAAQVRKAGLPVTVLVRGDPRPLPAGLNLSAYRIIQEALTNVLKHARPASAQVLVRYLERELQIQVTDPGPPGLSAQDGRNGSGHGLIGMRERVAVYGGQLEVGPAPGGGYRVWACLPLEPPP